MIGPPRRARRSRAPVPNDGGFAADPPGRAFHDGYRKYLSDSETSEFRPTASSACSAATTSTSRSPATTSGSYARSGRFPAPAVIVLAGDCLAVTCHTGNTVVSGAAEFAWLVALTRVG